MGLLDEATSALDVENESLVQASGDGLVQSGLCRTVIVIAHRLSTVKHAGQIVVMEEGEIKKIGNHKKLLECEGIYARLVQQHLGSKADEGAESRKAKDGKEAAKNVR